MKELELVHLGEMHIEAFDPDAVVLVTKKSGVVQINLSNGESIILDSRHAGEAKRLWALLTNESNPDGNVPV
jgi:hypothetical protein